MSTHETDTGTGEIGVAIDVDALPPARERLVASLQRAGCPQGLVDDAAAVASELVMNGLLHGSPDADGEVRLRWSVEGLSEGPSEGPGVPTAVVLEVDDAGGDTTPTVQSPAGTDGGGRGLRLVEALSRTWGVTSYDGGTRVTAVVGPVVASG